MVFHVGVFSSVSGEIPLFLFVPLPASAQVAPAPPPDLTAEDLAEIAAALGADLAASPSPPPAPPAPPSQAAGGGGNAPDMAFILDFALAGFGGAEPMLVGAHDPLLTGFNLQQLELAVGGSVDTYFRMDGNLVFSPFGVEIEEIYATTLSLPLGLQVRAGQFLTRFGRQNPTHPHTWDFVTQPLLTGRVFGGEGNRGLGTEASVLLPLPWYVEVLASETMAGGEPTARSFYGGEDLGVERIGDLQTTVAVKQFFPLSHDLSLAWGLSWAGGPNPTGRDNRTEVYGSDVYFKYRPITQGGRSQVTLHAEAAWRRRQVPGDVESDWTTFEQLAWRLTPRFGLGARHELGTATRTLDGEVVAADIDPEWLGSRQRAAFAVTFWPTEFSRLRLQGEADFAEWASGPGFGGFAAVETQIGHHGAHAF